MLDIHAWVVYNSSDGITDDDCTRSQYYYFHSYAINHIDMVPFGGYKWLGFEEGLFDQNDDFSMLFILCMWMHEENISKA